MAGDPERHRGGRGDGRRLLVLGAGPAQLGLLAAARRRGLFVIAADRDPSAPGFRFADRRALVSAEDEVAVERLAEAERVDGVIAPGIDWPVAIAARVARRLGLPHPLDPDTATLATSKLRQREKFREAGVPQPRWEFARSVEEARAAAERVGGYPLVVKASDRQGQRGLGLVREPEDFEPAVTEALAAARGGSCLVEEYAAGRELTVNAFVRDGRFVALTVTDRLVADPPAFGVALAHAWPSAQPPADVRAAVDAAESATRAAGVREGPTYTQVLAAAEGPRIVELAARLGGGHDAELCAAALGVDLNELALASAVGERPDDAALAAHEQRGGACVHFLVAPEGRLAAVAGVEAARARDGIVDVRIYRSPGWTFGPLRRGADRAGAVIAVGADRDDALARAAAAAAAVRFDVAEAAALA